MKYKIINTRRFDENLQDIITYIRDEFSSKEANEYLNYLHEQIENLKIFPDIVRIPRSLALLKQGYRVLVSKQNLLFYKIDEINKNIILYTIVSSKQDYINLI